MTTIKLNVGGEIFTTTKSTLTSHPNTLLGKIFSQNKLPETVMLDDAHFFDRDPKIFKHIMQYYRTNILDFPDDISVKYIQAELEYWCIDYDEIDTPDDCPKCDFDAESFYKMFIDEYKDEITESYGEGEYQVILNDTIKFHNKEEDNKDYSVSYSTYEPFFDFLFEILVKKGKIELPNDNFEEAKKHREFKYDDIKELIDDINEEKYVFNLECVHDKIIKVFLNHGWLARIEEIRMKCGDDTVNLFIYDGIKCDMMIYCCSCMVGEPNDDCNNYYNRYVLTVTKPPKKRWQV